MTDKRFVCQCEDVTLSDIEHAIDRGYTDIEEIKRYTGFGTGPCQGKECVVAVATLLQRREATEVQPFTSRPPLAPTPLRFFAGVDDE